MWLIAFIVFAVTVIAIANGLSKIFPPKTEKGGIKLVVVSIVMYFALGGALCYLINL